MRKRKELIKAINEIYKLGYLPSRENQSYTFKLKSKTEVGQIVNCFEHACFNLKNEHFVEHKLTHTHTKYFWLFGGAGWQDIDTASELFGFLQETGLIVHTCKETDECEFNEWKVALYFSDDEVHDFHFLRQEKNGEWTSKCGHETKVERYS